MTAPNQKLQQLAHQLHSAETRERVAAATALVLAGEAARPVAVTLARAAADTDEEVAAQVAEALENLGAPELSSLAELVSLLNHQHADCGYWGATLIGRLGESAAPAVKELASAVATHPAERVRERAAWALGRIGPGAKDARTSLQAAAAGGSPRLARLAGESLERIGPN